MMLRREMVNDRLVLVRIPPATRPMRLPLAHVRNVRFAASLVTLLGGCATAGGPGSPRLDRATLTQGQLAEQHVENAYDAVQALRSNWLQERGPDSFLRPSRVIVFVDNVALGTVESLKTVPIRYVVSIHHLDGLEATARYGGGHGAGAIVVSTYPPSETRP
jgi:hypothetical protein